MICGYYTMTNSLFLPHGCPYNIKYIQTMDSVKNSHGASETIQYKFLEFLDCSSQLESHTCSFHTS